MRVNPKVIILTFRANYGQVRKTARDLGISTGTVIYWKKRAATGYRSYSTLGLVRNDQLDPRQSAVPP
jgi:hypothetical protein